jgi:hypothetical protein
MMRRAFGIGLLALWGIAAHGATDDLDELTHLLAQRAFTQSSDSVSDEGGP